MKRPAAAALKYDGRHRLQLAQWDDPDDVGFTTITRQALEDAITAHNAYFDALELIDDLVHQIEAGR